MRRLATLGTLLCAAICTHPQLAGAQEPATIQGHVLDATTGRGLGQAEVIAISSHDTTRARTTANGAWRLTLSDARHYVLRARMLGYAPREVGAPSAAPGGAPIDIRLRPVPLSLDAVVVSAARREQRLADAVVTTEIISRRDIEQSGASDVASALIEHTGIQLDGGTPTGAGLQLQGFEQERILVLLDGQPLTGRVNGSFDLARLPTSMVERVEVVKGPQSTLFGSDAMGGVVNIITRAPTALPAVGSVNITAGSFGRRDADAAIAGTQGRLGYAVDGGYRHLDLTPGYSSDAFTRSQQWNVRARLSLAINPTLSVNGSMFGLSEEQRYQTSRNFQFADNNQRTARLGATWQKGSHRLTPLFYISHFDHLSRSGSTPRPVSDSGARDVQELTKLELTYSGIVRSAMIDAGLELRRERLVADRLSGGHERSLDAVEPFAQVTLTRGALSLVPGMRFSWNEEWGHTATPRVAALYRPRPELALRASVARGFRAPGFKELYLDYANPAAGYAVRGNANLRPESSTNASLGIEWAGPRLYARATGFYNKFTDFIESYAVAGEPGVYSYDNIASGRTDGVELEAGVTAGRARFEGGYAYLDTRDNATGKTLLGRPTHSGRISASYAAWDGFRASVSGTITGRVPIERDTDGNVTTMHRAFPRLDLHARQALTQDVALSIGIDNAFDERMGDEWPGFTGRMVSLRLTWQPFNTF